MRFMIMVKANEDTEAGVMPTDEELAAMGAFNEQLVQAGILLAGDGLHPSSRGARVHFSGDKRTVVDGPFTEAKELIAGYWMIDVKSLDEAVEWVKRIPSPDEGEEAIVEIRPVYEAEDFGDALTPELRDREAAMRAQTEGA